MPLCGYPHNGKSRLVPVSPGTLQTLRTYHDLRIAVAPADPGGAFFVSGRGTGYSTSTVQAIFHDLTVQAGLREPDGSGPRLHDLRATFAVTRLLLWYRDGEPVMARLPLLSTYLGHACISDTEVYLNSRELHQPGEKPQVSRSQQGRNSVPCLPTAAV